MVSKPKGNLKYEIGIAILVIVLLGAILYPAKVWKQEDITKEICQARMSAIQQIELQFLPKNQYLYTDSLCKAIKVVKADPYALAGLDSSVMWEALVEKAALKKMIESKQFPEELRAIIDTTLNAGLPLVNLGNWDSLFDQLAGEVRAMLDDSLKTSLAVIDTNVAWVSLLGEHVFRNILENESVPNNVRSAIRNDIFTKGLPVQKTRAWTSHYWPVFYDSLKSKIDLALLSDVYSDDQQKKWEADAKSAWFVAMDTLSQTEKDTLWVNNQKTVWENERDLLWRDAKSKLWRVEKKDWVKNNESTWQRVIKQNWQTDRKKIWVEEQQAIIPVKAVEEFEKNKDVLWAEMIDSTWAGNADSLNQAKIVWADSVKKNLPETVLAEFKVTQDSLWRSQVDTLWIIEGAEYSSSNKKAIQATIENLWEQERWQVWLVDAYESWLKEKETDKTALWEELKEILWKDNLADLWRNEQKRYARKTGARYLLDQNLKWSSIIGKEKTAEIVNGLSLPGTTEILGAVKRVEKGSALYKLGLVSLFRDELLVKTGSCPEVQKPYLLKAYKDGPIPKVEIYCPIQSVSEKTIQAAANKPEVVVVDTVSADSLAQAQTAIADSTAEEKATSPATKPVLESAKKTDEKAEPVKEKVVIVRVDPATSDTSYQSIQIPAGQKIFGGASAKSHGYIDGEGKKSWEKRSR